ncbi:MAG TPA: hypothetical protein VMG12_12520, partial [Polyangiaceae bacterium]|nr:hypothetical protein [Polyangiaceae bacterium]
MHVSSFVFGSFALVACTALSSPSLEPEPTGPQAGSGGGEPVANAGSGGGGSSNGGSSSGGSSGGGSGGSGGTSSSGGTTGLPAFPLEASA